MVERSTVNPARAIRRPDLGTMKEGSPADIAVLANDLSTPLCDDDSERMGRCGTTMVLQLPDVKTMGPYTNFK